MTGISSVVRFWALGVPFVCWLWLHHWGNIAPLVDNVWYSHWVTYHFGYLAKGIFPLWDPFRAWGWPDVYDTRFFGDLNPLYLIVLSLTIFHVPPFVAFNIFLVVLYLLTGIGVYLFTRKVWGRELPALVVYAMFMLSMIGELLFSQLTVMSMLFSSVWFFYFFSGYLKAPDPVKQKKYFAGLVLSLMLVVSTYVPFFFVVSMSALILAAALCCPSACAGLFKKIALFARTMPLLFWAGAGSLALALLPGVFFYLSTARGDMVLLWERNAFGAASNVMVPLGMISHSSLAAQVSIGEFLSDQDFVMNTFCYVPVFLLVLLSLGSMTRMDVRHRVIFTTAFLILIFALAGVTPVHFFLYQHVALFRLFRNLYFLGPLLMLTFAVLAAGQLQALLDDRPRDPRKRGWHLLWIVLIHAGWMIVLLVQERVLWSTYATVAGSSVVFTAYCFGFFDRGKGWLLAGLVALAMLQPAQLITIYWSVWGTRTVDVQLEQEPAFAYTRPLRGRIPEMEKGLFLAPKTKFDESGFRQDGYYGTRDSYALYTHIHPEDLQEYARYKFVVFDSAAFMDGERPDWTLLQRSLSRLQGPAWVNDPAAAGGGSDGVSPVSEPSGLLRVTEFDPNHVRLATNFPSRKFLVYNDSYYPGWSVSVNGKKAPLLRANGAFKGVWVDAGPRLVEFKFGSAGQYLWHWSLVGLFAFWGVYVVALLAGRKRCLFRQG